jgi:hypothetical protein
MVATVAAQERTLQVSPAKPAPPGERRIALVIGNSAYKSSPLKNPVRDARAISKALAASGFRVALLEDASLTAMRRAVRSFGDELAAGGVGLFYYAGHGMQVRGRNYLIPVNADIEREDEVEDGALDANFVLAKMDTAKNALNLMILDACRNNPFARSFRSATQGLAQMDAPSGTLVAFATAPGSVASDGDGDNGLYTKHLLAAMRRPGLPIEQVFKEVRIGVGRDTGDRQVPWESSSLKGNFYFVAPGPGLSAEAHKRELDSALARQQQKMEAMIRELLAKQRAELEAEIRKRDQALAGKSPPAPKTQAPPKPPPAKPPVQLAALAPAPVAQAVSARLPKVGDRWEYLYTDTFTRKTRRYEAQVVGVAANGILESDTFGPKRGQRAHGAEAELLIMHPVWVFSPYLQLFEAAKPGARWADVKSRNDGFCAREPSCSYSARVLGPEQVSTPAGTFDAVKVTVDLNLYRGGFQLTRRATFWYAQSAKRMVKSTLRTLVGSTGMPEYDLELVSYKLD